MNIAKALEILELDSTANSKDIKKAYRRMAMIYHPDRNPGEDAQQQFIEISEAYEFLNSTKNTSKHKAYNNNPRNKFRNQNHKSRYDYKEYFESREERSKKARESYDREFSKQSDILFHKLYKKYKESYQRKLCRALSYLDRVL